MFDHWVTSTAAFSQLLQLKLLRLVAGEAGGIDQEPVDHGTKAHFLHWG